MGKKLCKWIYRALQKKNKNKNLLKFLIIRNFTDKKKKKNADMYLKKLDGGCNQRHNSYTFDLKSVWYLSPLESFGWLNLESLPAFGLYKCWIITLSRPFAI